MILSTVVIVFLLIMINALYVAAEFSAVSVRKGQIRQLAEQGNVSAARLLPWIDNPHKLDKYVAACQIGITLSSLMLGAYGQASVAVHLAPFIERLGDMQAIAAQSTAAVAVLIGLTILQVIIGELVPKSLALQYSTRSALLTFIPMQWSLRLFSWFISLLNGSGVALLRLFRIPNTGHRHIHSPEEIQMLIAESRDGGLLEPDEHLRLHRALQLGARPIHQLMTPRRQIAAIDIDTPVDRILNEVANSPYSHLPVCRGESLDNIIGILHTKEVVIHYIQKGSIGSIQEIMRPVIYVPENVTADSLLSLMRRKRTHQAIIIDEFGGTEGFVTLEDLLKEMLGEVADEFKVEASRPEVLPDGRVRLPGMMRVDEAVPWTGVHWQGEADTVGGLIIEVLGRVPDAGEHLTIDGVEIEIEQVEHHAVISILASVPHPEENANG
ncbi:MAG: hemolysin family protein [Syntrophobacteraceae bacterium]